MRKMSFIILIICIFWFSSCATNDGNSDKINLQAKQTESKIDLDNITKISRTQDGFDLWYSFALKENGEIWATAGWNTRGDFVYRWSNNNRKWDSFKLPVSGMGVLARVFFTTSLNGYITESKTILRSEDGGSTWEATSLPRSSAITRLQSLGFQDDEVGFIGGTTGYMDRTTFEPVHGIEILCTNNSGKNFQICYKDKKAQTVYEIINLKQKISVALIDGPKILITNNKGKNWSEKKLPTTAKAITVDDNDTLWILEKSGRIFYSNDVGISWNEAKVNNTNLESESWNSIAFGKDGIGIAVADGGLIAISEDGQNWQVRKPDKMDEDLFSVQIRSPFVVIQGKYNFYTLNVEND